MMPLSTEAAPLTGHIWPLACAPFLFFVSKFLRRRRRKLFSSHTRISCLLPGLLLMEVPLDQSLTQAQMSGYVVFRVNADGPFTSRTSRELIAPIVQNGTWLDALRGT